jgi:peptide/nickel transport system ATP-binding protein
LNIPTTNYKLQTTNNKSILPLLQIKNLQVDFETELGTSTAVTELSLEVNRGEIVAIVGESGSGKSVTALSILQLLSPKTVRYPKGQILFSADGTNSIDLLAQNEKTLRSIRGNQTAMIFQEPMTSLNPVFTCGNQVMETIKLHQRIGSAEARTKTIALFEKVKLPDPKELFNRYPHQLSGGQKQRVMIAMAMSCSPSLLICDEPTTALDVTVQKTILELLKELQRTTLMGIIFITHDLGVVAEIADRAIVMYKGSVVEQGNIQQLFGNPAHPYTKGLLACRPVLHSKGERLPVVGDFMDEGNEILTKKASSISAVGAGNFSTIESRNILLRADAVSVWFPTKTSLLGKPLAYTKAVDRVSFNVYEGETLGLVGESGCGKTTLGRALLRLIEPSAGKIYYKGTELTALNQSSLKRLRKELQIIFQDPYSSLNPRLSIGDALSEPLKVHGLIKDAKKRTDKIAELLEKVNMKPEHMRRYPHEFSGGQRQRIVIARALALEPSFIICDESVSALDVSIQAQVLNLLNDLKKEFGFTVIFISHDLSVVRYISDRIMVMNKGAIEEIGESEQVYHHPASAYTRKLISSIPNLGVA